MHPTLETPSLILLQLLWPLSCFHLRAFAHAMLTAQDTLTQAPCDRPYSLVKPPLSLDSCEYQGETSTYPVTG